MEDHDAIGALPLESQNQSQGMPASPKEHALEHSSSGVLPAAAAGAAAGAAVGEERRELPYSLYRSLRLENIRSALGLSECCSNPC